MYQNKVQLPGMEFMIFFSRLLRQWTIFTKNLIFEISLTQNFLGHFFFFFFHWFSFLIMFAEAASNILFLLVLFAKEGNFIIRLSIFFCFSPKWKCLRSLLTFHVKTLLVISCKQKLRTLKIKIIKALNNKWVLLWFK